MISSREEFGFAHVYRFFKGFTVNLVLIVKLQYCIVCIHEFYQKLYLQDYFFLKLGISYYNVKLPAHALPFKRNLHKMKRLNQYCAPPAHALPFKRNLHKMKRLNQYCALHGLVVAPSRY